MKHESTVIYARTCIRPIREFVRKGKMKIKSIKYGFYILDKTKCLNDRDNLKKGERKWQKYFNSLSSSNTSSSFNRIFYIVEERDVGEGKSLRYE